MLTRRRVALVSTLFVALLALALSTLVPSWKSLPRGELPEWTKRFGKAIRAHSDAAPASLLHIGHRAGSFEEYARNLDGELEHARPVTELMDMSFGPLGLNAIEIDVRSSPIEGDTRAVVVHDRIDPAALSTSARDYIDANSVTRLLRHFVQKGYHRQGKRLFVELKASNASGLDAEGRAAIDRTAQALETTLRSRSDASLVRKHVELISFNRFALEHARKALGAAAPLHRLHMILTSNQHPDFTYELIREDLRALDDTLTTWLSGTPLLNGVLFDPRYVDGFATLFNRINAKRKARGLDPLDLHLSTYSHDYLGFVERMSATGQRLRNVRGLVYEVRRDD